MTANGGGAGECSFIKETVLRLWGPLEEDLVRGLLGGTGQMTRSCLVKEKLVTIVNSSRTHWVPGAVLSPGVHCPMYASQQLREVSVALAQYCRGRNRGSQNECDLAKVTQVYGGARTRVRALNGWSGFPLRKMDLVLPNHRAGNLIFNPRRGRKKMRFREPNGRWFSSLPSASPPSSSSVPHGLS